MYRILFHPTMCCFIVQLSRAGGLFWTACRDGKAILRFETHQHAMDWAENIGLQNVYKLQRPPKDRAAIFSPMG